MTVIETRLSGRQASVNHITRCIHRQLGQGPLARVELRYSTQSAAPLAPQAAKQAISTLLRESGMGLAAVSVRAHEGPIDDATGEHLLRMFPARKEEAKTPRDDPSNAPRSWWSRLLKKVFGRKVEVIRDEPMLASEAPAMTRAEAVAHLREAVGLACSYLESSTGSAIVPKRGETSPEVAEACVVVRLEALHRVLGPLVAGDAVRAAQSIGPMVRANGQTPSRAFRVSYRYQARTSGDGTAYASESDVEVTLRTAGSDRPPTGTSEQRPSVDGSTSALLPLPPAAGIGTLMPKAAVDRSTALTIRVLGTLSQKFDRPFDLKFDRLPAQFDRNVLEGAGFGHEHPELLAVASNSCPLLIDASTFGQAVLNAGIRKGIVSAYTAMYHDRSTLKGLVGEVPIPTSGLQLVVNSPLGVHDPISGRQLSPLVIELLPAWQSLPSTAAPMQ